ncbi:hypothetical protein ALC60_07763 [Trachymyrmex zeteki]|uniref:Uncharacterized protein n=1 Tax=Mycetomoellerius zeteki TaxID=64791 RepID=A0A151WZ26_9HYME|nr:hypothetical protein ALC60_07763 [Trachymyrmex zeteki]
MQSYDQTSQYSKLRTTLLSPFHTTCSVFRRSISEFFGAYRETGAKGRGIIERDPSILPAIFRAGPTKPPPDYKSFSSVSPDRPPPARPPYAETNHPQVFSPGAPPANRITAVRCPACPGVRMHGPTHTGQNIRECPTRNAIAKPFYDTDSFLLLRQNKGLTPPPPPISLPPPLPEYTSIAIKSMSKESEKERQDEAAAKEEAARVGGRWRRQRRRWRYRSSGGGGGGQESPGAGARKHGDHPLCHPGTIIGFAIARTHTGPKRRCLSCPRIFVPFSPSPAPHGRLPQITRTRAYSRETAEGNGPAFNVNRHARLIRGRKERERSKAESDGATTRLGRERGRDRGDRRDFPAENLTSPTTSHPSSFISRSMSPRMECWRYCEGCYFNYQVGRVNAIVFVAVGAAGHENLSGFESGAALAGYRHYKRSARRTWRHPPDASVRNAYRDRGGARTRETGELRERPRAACISPRVRERKIATPRRASRHCRLARSTWGRKVRESTRMERARRDRKREREKGRETGSLRRCEKDGASVPTRLTTGRDPRDKERAVRGIILFPEFDDAPPGLVPGPGAPPMIKGDAGERGTRVGSASGGGASISNFLFPDELACVENVACNVATHTRESERELHILSTQIPGGEENDGGTRRRRPGAAAPRRNTGNPAFAEYFFDDFRARLRAGDALQREIPAQERKTGQSGRSRIRRAKQKQRSRRAAGGVAVVAGGGPPGPEPDRSTRIHDEEDEDITEREDEEEDEDPCSSPEPDLENDSEPMEIQASAVTAAAANLHALRQHVFKMSDYWQQPQRGPPQHSPGIQHSIERALPAIAAGVTPLSYSPGSALVASRGEYSTFRPSRQCSPPFYVRPIRSEDAGMKPTRRRPNRFSPAPQHFIRKRLFNEAQGAHARSTLRDTTRAPRHTHIRGGESATKTKTKTTTPTPTPTLTTTTTTTTTTTIITTMKTTTVPTTRTSDVSHFIISLSSPTHC